MRRIQDKIRRPRQAFRSFFAHEAAGGIVLAIAAVAALLVSNSPWQSAYQAFNSIRGVVDIGGLVVLEKPLLLWVNDLWMAVFFLLVGLEIKREVVVGELAQPGQALLPAAAAFGGMAVPAAIYVMLNLGDTVALRGWAIPSATDIAFALAIVMLLGSRVPVSLRVFLTAVAIIDDLGAIVMIAIFYTANLSLPMLAAAVAGGLVLLALNRAGVTRADVYVVVGLVIWLCVLKSGVHATLAGVVTALAIPLKDGRGGSPAQALEHGLHPWVAFAVLPMFAFANAGVDLTGLSLSSLAAPVPLGIAAGLVVGKAIGVYGTSWALIRAGVVQAPKSASARQFFGVCVLCGVGFTMSLFIGGLAFETESHATQVKLGVLAGSTVAGLLGTAILAWRR